MDINVTDAMFALLRTAFDHCAELDEGHTRIIKNNLKNIYKISTRNDIAHIVGYALETQGLIDVEDECFAEFQKQQYLAIYRCEGMEYEISRIRIALENSGIDFVMLKGATIRGMYPEGWMRTSSDIDILVRRETLDDAERVLVCELGYIKGYEGTHDRSLHTDGGIHIELHFDLIEENKANNARDVLNDVWEHTRLAEGKSAEHEMLDGMFYFYHIAHLAKHVEYAGSGIRPFIDLWLINNSEERSDVSRKELLLRGGLDKFAGFCDELSLHWFEAAPISDDGKRFERFILNCGIYGSEENRIIINRKARGGTLGYIWRRLFYPYRVLVQLYPVLKKHKWLTPFCQMARWFKLITGEKTKKAINEVKLSVKTNQSDVQEMQKFLFDMGLDCNAK